MVLSPGGSGERARETLGRARTGREGLKGARATGRRDGALVLAVPMATVRGEGKVGAVLQGGADRWGRSDHVAWG